MFYFIHYNFSLSFVFYVSIRLLKPITSFSLGGLLPSFSITPFYTILQVLTSTPKPPALFRGYIALGSKKGALRGGTTLLGINLLLIFLLIY